MKTLEDFQEDGARFLAANKRAMLADEPGLGKTLQAIRACDHIGAKTVLVVCPPSVVVNWRREFADSSLLDPELTVTTPMLVERLRLADHYDAIILDEAHYYKTPRARRTKAVYGPECEGDGIIERSPCVFLLTGSPMPNDPSEIWTHLHALQPGLIPGPTGTMAYIRFQQTYCQIQQTPFGPKITGVRASKVAQLREILSRFLLRRLENEIDLPELRISPLYVEGTIHEIENCPDAATVKAVLAADGIAGLKKIAGSAPTLRRLLGLAKIHPTIAFAEEWLKNNDGKLCLYAWHTDVLETFKRSFFGRSAAITGSTSQVERQKQVDKFQTDDNCRVFIGQIQAAGEAITLTKASLTLLVEPSWVPKDNYQAIKRIHRYGQDKPCEARFVTVVGSVDDAINKALVRKEAMISEVLAA